MLFERIRREFVHWLIDLKILINKMLHCDQCKNRNTASIEKHKSIANMDSIPLYYQRTSLLYRVLYILLLIETVGFVHFVITHFPSKLLKKLTTMNTSMLQYKALLLVHLENLDSTYRSYTA